MTTREWAEIHHFKSREFDSRDLPGSGQDMNWNLVSKLDIVREMLGVPVKINSGIRTLAHNLAVGGKPKSAHLTGKAADISAKDPAFRLRLLKALLAVGFTRFEITPWHIHVDVANDQYHPQGLLMVLNTKEGTVV